MRYSLSALILLLFLTAPAFSQAVPTGGAPPMESRVNTDRMRQQEMSGREWQLRNFGKEPTSAAKDDRQLKALMAQTEEDFTRILTLHNEIARALSSKSALNYQFVSEAMGEIKKRAGRVQSSLALRMSPEEAPVKVKTETEMKDSLIKLCNEIRSFVTNPVIDKPNTVDADQLLKARRDLESLIQLSGLIKKDADKAIKQN